MKDLKEECEKLLKAKPPETKPKITAAVTKSDYHPVKNLVKDLEKDKQPQEEPKNINLDFIKNEIEAEQNEKVSNAQLIVF